MKFHKESFPQNARTRNVFIISQKMEMCKQNFSTKSPTKPQRREFIYLFEQYVLAGSTVRSYLTWLKDTCRLNVLFENNMLLWQRI